MPWLAGSVYFPPLTFAFRGGKGWLASGKGSFLTALAIWACCEVKGDCGQAANGEPALPEFVAE
jgi:hypothetical protein